MSSINNKYSQSLEELLKSSEEVIKRSQSPQEKSDRVSQSVRRVIDNSKHLLEAPEPSNNKRESYPRSSIRQNPLTPMQLTTLKSTSQSKPLILESPSSSFPPISSTPIQETSPDRTGIPAPIKQEAPASKQTEILSIDPEKLQKMNHELHKAVLQGDLNLAKSLIDQGAPISETNKDGLTPIQVAIVRKDEKMVRLFDPSSYLPTDQEVQIAIKEIVNLKNFFKQTKGIESKVHFAAYQGNVGDLKALETIDQIDELGLTPLHYAIYKCTELKTEIVQKLLTGQMDSELIKSYQNQYEVISYLAEKSNLARLDPFGNSYLHFAAILCPEEKSDPTSLQKLLETKGANPNSTNRSGLKKDLFLSPLFYSKVGLFEKHPFALNSSEVANAKYEALSWPAWGAFIYGLTLFPSLVWAVNPLTMWMGAHLLNQIGVRRTESAQNKLSLPLQKFTLLSVMPQIALAGTQIAFQTLSLPFRGLNWLTRSTFLNNVSHAIQTPGNWALRASGWITPITNFLVGASAVNKVAAVAKETLQKSYGSWKYLSKDNKLDAFKSLALRTFSLFSAGANALLFTGLWNPLNPADSCGSFDPQKPIHELNPKCKDQAAHILGGPNTQAIHQKERTQRKVKYHPNNCKEDSCVKAFNNVQDAYNTLYPKEQESQNSLLWRPIEWIKSKLF